MTGQTVEVPAIDPTEERDVRLTNADITDLMHCVDGMVRATGLANAETAVRLAAKLGSGRAVASATTDAS